MSALLRAVKQAFNAMVFEFRTVYVTFAVLLAWVSAMAQTSSSGAVTGVALDPAGSAVPGVALRLRTKDTHNVKIGVSDNNGWFRFASVTPGTYDLEASKAHFKTSTIRDLHVHVTEALHVDVHLELAGVVERAEVLSKPLMVQLDGAVLGKTVNEEAVHHLPLVTRNFAQIAGLSPGVVTGVYNAGDLGSGGIALSQIGPSNDGMFAHGARSYDNNWTLDGISVSDVLGAGSASGGIPVPNPETLQEFKVQTGLYDATFGRAAGANISIITKQGSNEYHGSFFEFLRNDVLDANEFFRNQTAQRRPTLKQNQFGFALGGPIQKDRLFFFGSYQGTRQTNGAAAGQARISCTASLSEPPLTTDRSAAALGSLFGGMSGASGGVTINPDGSNINPVALALLNFKLPNGNFLIPTPQKVDKSKPLTSQAFSVLTEPCQFSEDQLLTNLDYGPAQKDRLGLRFFISHTDQSVTFPGNGMNSVGNTLGFSSPGSADFVVLSLTETHVLSSATLNEAKVGFVRTVSKTGARTPFTWSDIGVLEGNMNSQNELPGLQILGSLSMTPAFPRTYGQDSFVLSDVFMSLKERHSLQFGASATRLVVPLHFAGFDSFVQFLSWPDFLLGLNAASNGTGMFSNVFQSSDGYGLLDRDFRAWEASAFAQDDYRVSKTLTVNLGLRYERPGQFGDDLGRNASFDVRKADANPSPTGSLDGIIVASNFPGELPPGVTRVDNTFGTYAVGQNTFAPRTGFAWQVLPKSDRIVLRGGYGLYYSRPTGQVFTASVLAAPFGMTRISTGLSNASATFQAPFAQPFPTPNSFPLFLPYSPSSKSSVNALAPNFRPALMQQFSLNLQAELRANCLLEIAYVGTHGTHLQRFRSLDQALDASPEHPIRGQTSNTIANLSSRLPIPGIRPDSLREMESEGSSWYNGLEANLTKRLSHGLQFLASYTFSKALDSDGANINGTSAVNALTLGDQNSPNQRWGRSSFDRTHRFIFSETWSLGSPSHGLERVLLGGWEAATVLTIQSGNALTIADTNANNVFGISEDRAQLSGTCSKDQLIAAGPVQSKLGGYFNKSCFSSPLIIGGDGLGTAFGNSSTGIVDGPGQANIDFAISKMLSPNWLREKQLQLSAEFYNALNHPQFANPDANFSSPTFGVISGTAVNARVGQLVLKLMF